MTFAEAFRQSSTANSVDKPAKAGFVAAWSTLGGWMRQVLVDLLAADEPVDDPTAHFSPRDWADLPTHHLRSPS